MWIMAVKLGVQEWDFRVRMKCFMTQLTKHVHGQTLTILKDVRVEDHATQQTSRTTFPIEQIHLGCVKIELQQPTGIPHHPTGHLTEKETRSVRISNQMPMPGFHQKQWIMSNQLQSENTRPILHALQTRINKSGNLENPSDHPEISPYLAPPMFATGETPHFCMPAPHLC